jgi:hypothetical protein
MMRFAGLTASYPFVNFVRFVVKRFLFLGDLCVISAFALRHFLTRMMRFAGLTASYTFVDFVRFVVKNFLFFLATFSPLR